MHRSGKGCEAVRTQQLNRVCSILLILLSLTALCVVVWGYTQPPLTDEGAGAHIFQLSILALVPMTFVFFATADWSHPRRSAGPLVLAAVAVVLAFAALYYLEHVYYPGQFRYQPLAVELAATGATAWSITGPRWPPR